MIQLFKSLLGGTSRDRSPTRAASRPAANTRPRPTPANVDYRAVSIAPNIACDAASRDMAAGRRYLQREAPRLPLPGCPTPANCSCKYKKHADRRDSDRRLMGMAETNRWYAGGERRHHGGRRSKAN